MNTRTAINPLGIMGLLIMAVLAYNNSLPSMGVYTPIVVALSLLTFTVMMFWGCDSWGTNDKDEDEDDYGQIGINPRGDWNLDSHMLGGIGESYYP